MKSQGLVYYVNKNFIVLSKPYIIIIYYTHLHKITSKLEGMVIINLIQYDQACYNEYMYGKAKLHVQSLCVTSPNILILIWIR